MKTPTRTFFIALLIFPGCSHWKFTKYRRSDTNYAWLLSVPKRTFSVHYVNTGTYNMRFLSVGDTNLPTLLLIHGAPGSIETFDPFLLDTGITNHVRLLAMDRTGYGYSNFGKPDTSVMQQAKTLKSALENYFHLKNYSALGYSYGGPVAAVLASLDTAKVQKLFLVSASLAPGKEKTYAISKMIKNPFWGHAFPKVYRTANIEKLSHLSALNEVRFLYQTIRCEVYIVHGLNDKLIYPGNAMYMQQSLVAADSVALYTEKGGHRAIIWNNKNYIQQLILNELIASN
ncbi:MAG: alpha/beta hydrolase [Bacteroidetes bacterium]|nr:alpha/beta hydrolase [Bacteroidota bacterium]